MSSRSEGVSLDVQLSQTSFAGPSPEVRARRVREPSPPQAVKTSYRERVRGGAPRGS